MNIEEEFTYPVDNIVLCGSDSEYRVSMRSMMKMGKNKTNTEIDNPDEADAISADEQDFDQFAAITFMKGLFGKTEKDKDLMALYVAAAGAFLTTDPTTGIVVLFAYDNFAEFHLCLKDYFEHPENKLTENEHYIFLLAKMTK